MDTNTQQLPAAGSLLQRLDQNFQPKAPNDASILGGLIPELVLVQALQMAPRTFATMVANGRAPDGRVKIGRRVYYKREAIAAWLEKQGQKNPRRRTVKRAKVAPPGAGHGKD